MIRKKIAIFNIDGTDDGWTVMTNETHGIWALITAPDTFHETMKHLGRLFKFIDEHNK